MRMKYKKEIIFILSFFFLWFLVCGIYYLLSSTIWNALGSSDNLKLFYWAIMQILVWVVFPIFYLKKFYKVTSQKDFTGLKNIKKGLLYGLIIGIIWVSISIIIQKPSFDVLFSLTLLWLVTGIPIAEEFTFRGIILSMFQQKEIEFWTANIITAILFLLANMLEWAFQGVLSNNLNFLVCGNLLSLSLVLGWLKQESKSLYSSMILHSLNNFVTAII